MNLPLDPWLTWDILFKGTGDFTYSSVSYLHSIGSIQFEEELVRKKRDINKWKGL